MTVLGYILLGGFTLGILSLLSEGAKSGLHIDKWSDLWRKKGA